MGLLAGWPYYSDITVGNGSVDYQTKITVYYGSGTNGLGVVYCNSLCQADFDDLRFTKADGETLMPYWIESYVASTSAVVWVKHTETSPTVARMYYGKADATAVSNGANTFIQFEDLEWGSDGDPLTNDGGSVDWTALLGTPDIDTAQKYGGTRSGRLYSGGSGLEEQASFPQSAGATYAIMFRHRRTTTSLEWIVHGNGTKAITFGITVAEAIFYYDTDYRYPGYNAAVDTWELFEFTDINFTAGTYDIWLNGVKIKDAAVMQTRATESNVVLLVNNATTAGEVWYDDIIIRKWAATEPTFTFGSQQVAFTPFRNVYPLILAH